MNKIYKVIWSKAKNCYVVVSEIAKRNGKCKAAKTDSLTDSLNRRKRLADLLSIHTPALTKAVMALLLAGMIAMPNVAGAGTAYQNNTPVGNASAGGGNNASAYGNNAKASGNNSTAIGGGSQATGTGTIAVGQGAQATKASATDPEPEGAIAVGYGSAANATNSVVVGRKAKASGESAIAVGFSATAGMTQTDAQGTAYSELNQTIKNDTVLAGTTVQSATNYASLVEALTGLSTSGTDAQKEAATNYLNQLNARVTVLMSKNAIAVGNEAKALAQDSIAVGRSSQATGQDSIAVGRSSQAIGQDSIAVGRSATARGAYSVSIGQGARNRTAYGIAIGVTAGVSRAAPTTLPDAGGLTEGTGAIAIGYGASNFTYGTFQADESYENVKNTVAIGTKVHTHAQYAVAIGAFTDATAERSFALGTASTNNSDAHKGSRAGGQGSVVIGDQAEAFSDSLYENTTTGFDPGRATDTNANDAIAVGTQARVMAKNAVAMGGNISYTGLANDPYEVTRFTTIYGKTKAGEETGAIVGEGADAGIAIGGAYGTIDKDNGITIISEAAATYGKRGIAIGSGAIVTNLADYNSIKDIINSSEYITAKTNYETALSAYTNALNDCTVKTATYESLKSAFDTAYPTPPPEDDPTYPDYIADKNQLEAAESEMNTAKTAVNTANANLAEPLADYEAQRIKIDKLEADDAIKVEDAVAIGSNAKAGIARSIAMGSNSVTKDSDEAGIVTGVIGYDMGTGQPYAKDGRYSPTWMSTAGAFSVGGGTSDTGQTVTRRITNVAAGANDTDAVNVAQLKVAMDSTIMSSDNRNVGVGPAKERGLEIFSPYYHVTGIKDAAEASSFINKYETQAAYETQLNSELTTLNGHKTRIQTSIGKLNDDLTTKRAEKQALEDAGKTNEDEYQEVVALISHLESELSIQNTELSQKETEIANKEDEIADAGTTWNANKALYDTRAQATGTNATAIGYKAIANGDNTIAFGKEANAGAKSAIALGTGAAVAETGTRSISIGNKTGKVNGEDVTGSAVSGTDSISLGNGNTLTGNNSVGVGTGLTVTGKESIGIGTGHKVYGEKSGTLGDPNVLASDNSYVIGNDNRIGSTTYAEGDTITNQNIFIMGNENHVDSEQEHVYILGSNVTTTYKNSVFLGNSSAYVADNSGDTAKTTKGAASYPSATINGVTYNFAGGDEGKVAGVVSVGKIDGTRRIQNVAPGLITATSTDAINGSQLYAVMDSGLKFDANSGGPVTNKLGSKVSVIGATAQDGHTYSTENVTTTILQYEETGASAITVKFDEDPAFNSVITGSGTQTTLMDANGIHITNGDSTVNISNSGGTLRLWNQSEEPVKITNVKAGEADTDAVNVSQLNAAKSTVIAGTNITVTSMPDESTGGTTYTIDANDYRATSASYDNSNHTLNVKVEDNLSGKSQTFKAEGIAGLDDGMLYMGDFGDNVQVRLNNRVNVTGGATTETDLTDGNIGVVSAPTGTDYVDASLKIKLNKDINLTEQGSLIIGNSVMNHAGVTATTVTAGTGTNTKVTISDDGVQVGNKTYINNAGLNANNNKITNVAAGRIAEDSTDAINGSQLYQAIQDLTIEVVAAADKSAKVDKSTNTAGNGTGGGGTGTTAATTYTVSASTTTIENKEGRSPSKNLTIVETNPTDDPLSYKYTIDLADDINVNSVKAGETVINTDGMTIGDTTITSEGLTIKGGDKNVPSVTKDGINAGHKTIINVQAGKNDTDAVNVSQLRAVENSGLTFNGDKGSTTDIIKLGGKLDIGGDDNITTAAETGKLNIRLSKDLKVDSVKAGDTTINNDGLTVGDTAITKDKVSSTTFVAGDTTIDNSGMKVGDTTVNNTGVTIQNGPSMTDKGIDAGGKKITKVADATEDTDAVNFGQLKEYTGNIPNLGNQIANVDSRAKKGIAGAAALAALHPMEFDPDDKLTFAAGMGHYRGETAAALGLFYRADEKVMFSLGGTVGNGENLVNAGVSFSLDRTPRVTGSRTALTKEVVHLREQVAKQDARIAKQDAQIAHLTALVSQLTGTKVDFPDELQANASGMFPDNLDNKWAYDKLEELEQQGYIKGFAGRTLSRDEFAAALDTAMARGAKLDERLVKEFEPELSHVRIAHVEGKGNEEGNWYERPRFSHDKAEKNGIAKKQYRIQPKK